MCLNYFKQFQNSVLENANNFSKNYQVLINHISNLVVGQLCKFFRKI